VCRCEELGVDDDEGEELVVMVPSWSFLPRDAASSFFGWEIALPMMSRLESP
jgi:hypothetical protein